MSTLRVTNLQGGSAGSAPNFPDGAVITGVATVGVLSATTFYGSGANLSGIDATALKDSGGSVKIQANSDGAVVTGVLTAPTVSGTTGSFTGNVSVGGTLTYEDVTNVDSVGLITARNGIKVTGGDVQVGSAVTVDTSGINVTGVVTATSFIGSGANLTNLPPGGNVITGIASGSLAADRAIALAQDGKLFQFAAPISGINPYTNSGSGGSAANAAGGSTSGMLVSEVDRYVFFRQQGNLPRWYMFNGTSNTLVANDYIANSNPGSGIGKRIECCWDPDRQKVIAVWSDTTNSHRGYCAVGVFISSNNNIGWGTPVVFETDRVDYVDVCYDTTQDRVVIVYEGAENSGRAIVGTVSSSGQDITFGTATTIVSHDARNLHCTHDVNANKILITYENTGSNTRPIAELATVANTGNTITMVANSDVIIDDTFTSIDVYSDLEYDPYNQKSLFAYKGQSNYGYVKVLSISGNTISAGTRVEYYGANVATTVPNLSYNTGSNSFILSYVQSQHSAVAGVRPATISGTSVTLGTAHDPAGVSLYSPVAVANSSQNKACFTWVRNDNEYFWKILLNIASAQPNIQSTDQYIGFADQAYTDGQTATIKTIGNTVSSLSGLTTTSHYYVQADGTIELTWDSGPFAPFATNTPKAGRALNSTTLQIYPPTGV